MKGYDIDGVLTNGVIPDGECVIITGRPWLWSEKTIKELEKLNIINKAIYFNPESNDYYNRDIAGKWKAKMIKLLGVEEFYEDDEVQAEHIRKENPNCKLNIIK